MEKIKEVLIIDDSEIDNLIHTRLLKELQLAENVNCFLNGKTAIFYLKEIFKKNPQNLPDVIFLDLNMPLMDGWAFLIEYERLCANSNKIPKLYIVSCTINKKEITKALSHNQVSDFISKPVTPERLKSLTQSLSFAS